MTIDEFLAWEVQQPGRYEFLDGQPVPLEGSTQGRSLLISDIAAILRPTVRGTGMRVLINFRVRVGDEVRYPAVVIDAGPYVADALEPSQPYAVIDVDRPRDWSALPDVRYLSLKTGDDPEEVLTFISARTK
ncbi:Uma2 family endonuclease [Rhizobium sp. WSM1274]|uniref:Uma2 family endonuclease n=1 Tax=Rhizobium sp. WSM1274 TaxID=3138254 RepID=UPI0021A9649F|nr:Uma2 family endonuclease [Rhizobium leguminosarum]UWU29132.1 Uma2 family endonuclease [Rhizobium leguminosarum bv. viciae]